MFNSGTLSFVIEKIKLVKSYDLSKFQQRFDSYLRVTQCDPDTILGIQIVMKTLGLKLPEGIDLDIDKYEDDERIVYNITDLSFEGASPEGINKMEIGIFRSIFLVESRPCLI